MSNPYQTLGVAQNASVDDCRAAFRKLAKTCHPDLHPNDPQAEARFKEINAALEQITNPPPEQPFGFQSPPQWNNVHFNFGGSPFSSPFDDIFSQFRRSEISVEVRLTLEEAFTGKEVTITIPNGTGQQKELKLRIPPGTDDGMRLVVQQAGPPVNGRAGDVQILIRVLPHQRFTRVGFNLVLNVPVSAFDVLLGNEIEVNGIDGHTMRVAIPANFDSSRKLRLAGQGMADQNGQRGDLLVDLFIQYPAIPPQYQETIRKVAAAVQKT
jgi:DnaJ-class molecular chaperone